MHEPFGHGAHSVLGVDACPGAVDEGVAQGRVGHVFFEASGDEAWGGVAGDQAGFTVGDEFGHGGHGGGDDEGSGGHGGQEGAGAGGVIGGGEQDIGGVDERGPAGAAGGDDQEIGIGQGVAEAVDAGIGGAAVGESGTAGAFAEAWIFADEDAGAGVQLLEDGAGPEAPVMARGGAVAGEEEDGAFVGGDAQGEAQCGDAFLGGFGVGHGDGGGNEGDAIGGDGGGESVGGGGGHGDPAPGGAVKDAQEADLAAVRGFGKHADAWEFSPESDGCGDDGGDAPGLDQGGGHIEGLGGAAQGAPAGGISPAGGVQGEHAIENFGETGPADEFDGVVRTEHGKAMADPGGRMGGLEQKGELLDTFGGGGAVEEVQHMNHGRHYNATGAGGRAGGAGASAIYHLAGRIYHSVHD